MPAWSTAREKNMNMSHVKVAFLIIVIIFVNIHLFSITHMAFIQLYATLAMYNFGLRKKVSVGLGNSSCLINIVPVNM